MRNVFLPTIRYSLLYSLVTFVCLLGISSTIHADEDRKDTIHVVASFSILGNIVQVLGGDLVEVVTLVGPDSDGHLYQPTPSDGRALTRSNLVVINGLHFEGWIPRLIDSAGYSGPVVVASNGIDVLHVNDEPDPHAWQSLSNAGIYADNITRALIRLQPESEDYFSERNQRFLSEIIGLQKLAKEQFSSLPAEDRVVVTSHDAFGYFGREHSIQFIAPLGMSTDAEASAGNVARLIRQIKDQNIRAMFVENISDPRLMEQVSRETDVSIGGSLYSDALSPSNGPASTYLKMMRHNIVLISDALGATVEESP